MTTTSKNNERKHRSSDDSDDRSKGCVQNRQEERKPEPKKGEK